MEEIILWERSEEGQGQIWRLRNNWWQTAMQTESHKHMLAIDMRINTPTEFSTGTQHAQIHKYHGLLYAWKWICSARIAYTPSYKSNKHYKWLKLVKHYCCLQAFTSFRYCCMNISERWSAVWLGQFRKSYMKKGHVCTWESGHSLASVLWFISFSSSLSAFRTVAWFHCSDGRSSSLAKL